LIVGLAGQTPSPEERSFLASVRPAGIILFARNCRDKAQVRELVGAAQDAAGGGTLLVLIDQGGGQVRRLPPPRRRRLPPAAAYGKLYDLDAVRGAEAARRAARFTAADLRELGINVNCAPVLDVPVAGAHAIIGDRAYGQAPDKVAALGRAVAEGFIAGGVV